MPPGRFPGMNADGSINALSETVLIAEDDVVVRMIGSDYLRGCGYRVIEVRNADEALTILRQGGTSVDVVLCGIAIGGTVDAFGLSDWVKANRPGLDMILAGSIPRAAKVAADLCDDGPLPKPYEPWAVVDRIRRLRSARSARRRARAIEVSEG